MQTLAVDVVQAADPGFWRAREPGFQVEGLAAGHSRPAAPAALSDARRMRLLGDLLSDGYHVAGRLIPGARAARLLGLVRRLRRDGLPLELCWVYDEVWQLGALALLLLAAALGDDFQQLPALTVFWVEPGGGAGWRPHRDRAGSLGRDGRLASLTLWLALTPATPDNGCIYVLAPDGDRYHGSGEAGAVEPPELQHVRALPARPGEALLWNHELLHWGGRSSPRARGPRVSLGFEFVRPPSPYKARPLLALPAPPLSVRLALIADSVLGYQYMRPTSAAALTLATALAERYSTW